MNARIANELKALEGSNVRIEFDDGVIVRVRLIEVDLEEHDEIVYEVVEVVVGVGTEYRADSYYVAAVDSVRGFAPDISHS